MSDGQRIPPVCFWWLALLIVPAIVVWIRRAVRPPPKDALEAFEQSVQDDELKDKTKKGMWLVVFIIIGIGIIAGLMMRA